MWSRLENLILLTVIEADHLMSAAPKYSVVSKVLVANDIIVAEVSMYGRKIAITSQIGRQRAKYSCLGTFITTDCHEKYFNPFWEMYPMT